MKWYTVERHRAFVNVLPAPLHEPHFAAALKQHGAG